ncbi:MerR family transcriptional regulator [Alicyclobacillus sp. SO9]|uniref:MerR family transcriptional regulator n=1 Tax=Alicyclobacillus sp. SO9 TaxID=2665646 RepID=UPI0018E86982|nr:MerR family transcriptional regulator [Alicyclobacillus sp. SO9]QQE81449.1 MerR family transcriptional regulator [Alicyclobacillus sp. SO9]
MDTTFTIQQVAKITGLSVHTLRYYERIGLLAPVDRLDSGYRCYSNKDIEWIEFLNRLRFTGMSIRKMQQFAALLRQGNETIHERRGMIEQHEQDLRAHMAQLEENLKYIEYKIRLYKKMETNES